MELADDVDVTLGERVSEVVGRLNAAHAELVELVAEAIRTEAWSGPGIRSLEHWLTWQAGVSSATARQLHRVADALETHPETTAVFTSGRLTLDQTAAAVASAPEYDAEIAVVAPAAMVSQLRTIARASRRQPEPTPEDEDDPRRREQLQLQRDDDGWLDGRFRLAPDRAETLLNALDESRDRMFDNGATNVSWADALVDVCELSLGTQPTERASRYLTYLTVDTRRPIEGVWRTGISVNEAMRNLFSCDGLIKPLIVEGATPIGVGRSQRTVPDRTRRVVLQRDLGTCRSPWCGHTRGLDVHHIVHWQHGGPTDTSNLVTLCRRCHRRLHSGEFSIRGNPDDPDSLQFLNPRGQPMTRPQPPPDVILSTLDIDPAEARGPTCDHTCDSTCAPACSHTCDHTCGVDGDHTCGHHSHRRYEPPLGERLHLHALSLAS